MNKSYSYEGIEEWYAELKKTQAIPLEVLIEKLNDISEDRKGIDQDTRYLKDPAEVKRSPTYHYKTGCLDDPETVADLAQRGLHYESLEMGGTHWLAVTPAKIMKEQNKKVPLLLVFHREDYSDPFWAMKTLALFSAYNDAAAQKQDHSILYIVANDEPTHMHAGIITEGIQNYCGDKNKIYVDISNLKNNAIDLKDIRGFEYVNEDGKPVGDPDTCITNLGDIPVLNFSGRWVPCWQPQPLNSAGDGTVDTEWLIHSEIGCKLLHARRFASSYKTVHDPDVKAFWKRRGLEFNCHYVHGERWVIFASAETVAENLPVVVCLDEVNEPDEHSVLTAYSNYEYYCSLAAQGDCAVIFFAMESPQMNDWICDILQEAGRMYPVDLSRVYMTGHSHNGHFTQEFARRHPNVLAAIAPLGNSPGLPAPAVSHEAVVVDDERAAIMEGIDMPTCILCGCKEVGGLVPVNQTAHASEPGINVEGYAATAEGKIAMWNRRLKAERCTLQPVAELMETSDSANKATRQLGILSDRAETVYMDGFEHYIADIKNFDGNTHFRVVAVQNMPHLIVPSMHFFAWNYMRRFARDQKTGEVIELF